MDNKLESKTGHTAFAFAFCHLSWMLPHLVAHCNLVWPCWTHRVRELGLGLARSKPKQTSALLVIDK